jgi:iron(III) transport system ATP-binding protein
VAVSEQAAAGDLVTVAFRPEKVFLTNKGAELPTDAIVLNADIITTSYVGSRYEYDLKYGSKTLLVDSTTGGLAGGVRLVVPAEAVRLYPRSNVVSKDVAELMAVTH